VTHTVKGSMSAIRRSLKEGLLGDASNVRAARAKAGPFEALRSFPEFRDLVVSAAPLNLPVPPSSKVSAVPPTEPPPADRSKPPHTVAPVPQPQPLGARAPHISLEEKEPPAPSFEWVKWLLLIGLAVGSALLAFFLFPFRA